MLMSLRKCVYPYSTCCKIYFSCASRTAHSSTPNSEALQQESREEKNSLVTKDGIRYVIRSLTLGDLPQLMGLARQMDRIVPESCFHSWLKKDPNGIKVAITGRDEIIGAVCGVNNGDNDEIFFGGMFFVKPDYQNKGVGRMLWKLTFEHVGTRNAGLNAVPGKLETFRDVSGFPIHETRFTSIKYLTSSWPLDFTFLNNTPPPGISISPFHPSHLPSIFAFDFDLIGFKRTVALSLNLMEAGSRTLVALRNDGACAGFGTVKVTCTGKVRVGPLYADGPEVAAVLLRRLSEMMIREKMDGFVFVTTSANRHAVQWMDRLGVGVCYECDRLYSKKKLDVDVGKVYGQFDISFAPF